MKFHDEDLEPLARILSQITGVPGERLAGFAVTIAVFEEDETPSGRLISSTPNLRIVAQMLDLARSEVGRELDKLAGLS